MKLIIDIPEQAYKLLNSDEQIDWLNAENLLESVAKGIPYEDRPKGEWEFVQYDANPNIGNWHCTNCRGIAIAQYNFCPTCGAEMRGDV